MRKLLLVGVAVMAMLPVTAAARGRMAVFAGPRFAPFGWYDSYGPYWGPYGYYGFGPYFAAPNAGEVRLDTDVKDAEVFIDGSFAGTAGKLKTIRMRPGSYSIELRASGRAPFAQKIYVIAGKSIKLHPELRLESRP